MKTLKWTLISALGPALLVATGAASASPITFQFDLPAWTDIFAPAGLFGTSGVLDITVNNGASSDVSQTYLNSQITQVRLTTIAGTFADTWNDSDLLTSTSALGLNYISTNASGTPTLDLLPASVTSSMDWGNAVGEIQLGVLTPTTGGPTTVFVGNSSGFVDYAPFSDTNGNIAFLGLEETGTVLESIPEPATLALFGLGFAGLALSRRRLAHCDSTA